MKTALSGINFISVWFISFQFIPFPFLSVARSVRTLSGAMDANAHHWEIVRCGYWRWLFCCKLVVQVVQLATRRNYCTCCL